MTRALFTLRAEERRLCRWRSPCASRLRSPASDDVANAGEEVLEDVRAEDRLPADDAEMLYDAGAGNRRGCDHEHGAS